MTDVLRHLIAMNCDFFANFAYSIRMKSENMTYGASRNTFENSCVVVTGFGRPSDATLEFSLLEYIDKPRYNILRWIALMLKWSV